MGSALPQAQLPAPVAGMTPPSRCTPALTVAVAMLEDHPGIADHAQPLHAPWSCMLDRTGWSSRHHVQACPQPRVFTPEEVAYSQHPWNINNLPRCKARCLARPPASCHLSTDLAVLLLRHSSPQRRAVHRWSAAAA